ncbi:hypothetical protein [Halococcus sp. IIIV-5B]|nr:hypothetical protein [Halococcus sp. IIIV-5B]
MTVLGMIIPVVVIGFAMAGAALAWGYLQEDESWMGVETNDTESTGGDR